MNARLVAGLGVNDADYKIQKYGSIDRSGVIVWRCRIYQAWAHMLQRCQPGNIYQKKYPSYEGCAIDDEWRSFMAFREWMIKQEWEGKQIDKDILIPGNKIYRPDRCVFISSALNSFVLERARGRGNYPLGVSKMRKKFAARVRNPFTQREDFLGVSATPEEAHEKWRARKHELALIYAEQQTDIRIASALRARYLPENYYAK